LHFNGRSSVRAPGAELRSPAESIPQDWASLARCLAESSATLGLAPPRQFAGGFGNLNYLIEFDGKAAVLRRPPVGPLPPGANDMAREYRILSSLWRAYPLAPRALFYCAEPSVLGAPFLIIEYRPGIIIRDALPLGLAGRPETGTALSRHLIESLAALHEVEVAQIGLEAFGRPAGFLGRTLEGWATRGNALADLIDVRAFAETVAWLRHRIPADARPALLHSDFKLDNMILEPTTLAPVAVIDWDMGTRGDPLWDLAVLLSYWAEPEDPPCIHRIRQMPTAQPGFLRRHEVLDSYQQLSGRTVEDFTFYRVLSVFRSAIVFLQLFDRYRRDPKRNKGCAEFDTLGRELIDYAFEIASGRAE
jgi:aminoglycoside phosphotransferase (APT) family kinase protein